ncbi:MAG: hypothetical protein LBU41_00190, partial [Clostridiales Family XIII bacterium]|nr:hypothetical protein [Clostridiales Family XIII bacterium]
VPRVEVLFTKIEQSREFSKAFGAKGVGELCLIPTSPAVAHAYYRFDGKFRTKLPLEATAYRREKGHA